MVLMKNAPKESDSLAVNFTAEDLKLYPCLCEVLRRRGLPLLAQYTTAETARIFDCDIRVIQERIHSGKWPARASSLATSKHSFKRRCRHPAKQRSVRGASDERSSRQPRLLAYISAICGLTS